MKETRQAPDRTVEARRLPAGVADLAGEFTYTVLLEPTRPEPARPQGTDTSAERRSGARQRTRLRSGKIVDEAGTFVTECLVHDLSPRGGRLRLPPGTRLPPAMQLFDDKTGDLLRAKVLWRRDGDIGVAFEPPRNDPRARAIAESLRRKFYAVRN